MSTKTTKGTARRMATDSQVDFATKRVAKVITGFVVATALAGLTLSFYGLSAGVGQWMELPSWMAYLPAAILDLGAVAFTLAAYRRAALDRSTVWQWTCVGIATAASAAANAAHIALGGDPTPTRIVGTAAAAFAPLWAALATHQVMDLVAPAKPPRVPTVAPVAVPANVDAPTAPLATPPRALAAQAQDGDVATQDAPKRSSRPAGGYSDETRQTAVRMARAGSSRSQIAAELNVGRSTIVA